MLHSLRDACHVCHCGYTMFAPPQAARLHGWAFPPPPPEGSAQALLKYPSSHHMILGVEVSELAELIGWTSGILFAVSTCFLWFFGCSNRPGQARNPSQRLTKTLAAAKVARACDIVVVRVTSDKV
jgi:hypothetical protein